jgi:superfamily II DNA/RNA helicase
MKQIILIGGTGTGKTYKAINEYSVGKFCYIAPCRQLVYESFIEYSSTNCSLSTGEVSIYNNGNLFAVYESVNSDILKNYQTLIIDEAHFITDEERGSQLYNLICEAKQYKMNILLVTATLNFEMSEFEKIELKPFFNPPKKVEIDEEKFKQNIEYGLKTIVFCQSIRSADMYADYYSSLGYKASALHSAILPSDRLDIQYQFRNGELDIVFSTNILAQGINMPCENLYIPEDMFSNEEMYIQKLGRLGRFGMTNRSEVYYCTSLSFKDIKISKKEICRAENKKDLDFTMEYIKDGYYNDGKNYIDIRNNGQLVCSSFKQHEIISSLDNLKYSDIKYSKKFIKFISKYVEFSNLTRAMELLNEEEKAIKNVITKIKYDKMNNSDNIKILYYYFKPKNRHKQIIKSKREGVKNGL